MNGRAVALLHNWFLRKCSRDGIDYQLIDFDSIIGLGSDWRTNRDALLEQMKLVNIGAQLRLDRPLSRLELDDLRVQLEAYNAKLREEEEALLRVLGLAYSGTRVWWFQVRIREIRYVELFLSRKGIRYIQRYEKYHYRVKSQSGRVHYRSQERVPAIFGVALKHELVQPFIDELREHSFWPSLFPGSTAPQFKGYIPPAPNSVAQISELQANLAQIREAGGKAINYHPP